MFCVFLEKFADVTSVYGSQPVKYRWHSSAAHQCVAWRHGGGDPRGAKDAGGHHHGANTRGSDSHATPHTRNAGVSKYGK